MRDAELTALRRKSIGFVFQFFQLLPNLTVLENVELPLLLAGASNTKTIAMERLMWVGLTGKSFRLSSSDFRRSDAARVWPAGARRCTVPGTPHRR